MEDRTILQLQTKYKVAQVNRDVAETGNQPLRRSTSSALSQNSHEILLGLRKQIGPTASGFHNTYGECGIWIYIEI